MLIVFVCFEARSIYGQLFPFLLMVIRIGQHTHVVVDVSIWVKFGRFAQWVALPELHGTRMVFFVWE